MSLLPAVESQSFTVGRPQDPGEPIGPPLEALVAVPDPGGERLTLWFTSQLAPDLGAPTDYSRYEIQGEAGEVPVAHASFAPSGYALELQVPTMPPGQYTLTIQPGTLVSTSGSELGLTMIPFRVPQKAVQPEPGPSQPCYCFVELKVEGGNLELDALGIPDGNLSYSQQPSLAFQGQPGLLYAKG